MTDPINPSNTTPPSNDRVHLQEEYRHGADLFQRALDEHAESQDPKQKKAFQEVMDQALSILNGAAKSLKAQKLLQQNQTISQDYTAYQKNPTEETKSKLSFDLDQAKNLYQK
jgi:hypothetical protein